MEERNPKDEASIRLVAVIAGSAVLMVVWFYFHPFSALICSTFAIVVSVLCVWPPHLQLREGDNFRRKLND